MMRVGRVALMGAVFVVTVACRELHRERAPAPTPAAPRATVFAAPDDLVMEGTLTEPARVWRRARSLLSGKLELLPASFGLAVTTWVGASPLAAGIVDDSSPLSLAVVNSGRSPGLVVSIPLTNGAEFVSALANGADARFRTLPESSPGVTWLEAKSAAGELIAVAGNALVLGSDPAVLRDAAGYVASGVPASSATPGSLVLRARKAALVGTVAPALAAGFAEVRDELTAAALLARATHGGRAPDFADPEVVIRSLGAAAESFFELVRSSAELRVSAALLDSAPSLRLEITPEKTGSAAEWVGRAGVGDLTPLLRLPEWSDAAILWRRADSTDPRSTDGPSSSLFGDRLGARDRDRLASWMRSASDSLGGVGVFGVFGSESGPGAFVVGAGDGAALGRATRGVASIATLQAIAEPLDAFVGKLAFATSTDEVRGLGRVEHVRVRVTAAKEGGKAPPAPVREWNVAAASAPPRDALVVGPARVDAALAALLGATPPMQMLGVDPVLSRAAERAGGGVAGAAAVRFRAGATDAQGSGWAVLTSGSDRRVAWAELDVGEASLRALSALLAP